MYQDAIHKSNRTRWIQTAFNKSSKCSGLLWRLIINACPSLMEFYCCCLSINKNTTTKFERSIRKCFLPLIWIHERQMIPMAAVVVMVMTMAAVATTTIKFNDKHFTDCVYSILCSTFTLTWNCWLVILLALMRFTLISNALDCIYIALLFRCSIKSKVNGLFFPHIFHTYTQKVGIGYTRFAAHPSKSILLNPNPNSCELRMKYSAIYRVIWMANKGKEEKKRRKNKPQMML